MLYMTTQFCNDTNSDENLPVSGTEFGCKIHF